MKLLYAEEIPRAAGFMDQSPLGVVAAALIRWAIKQHRGGARSHMDSVLSVLAMVGALLVLGWLVGPGDEQGKHARPGEEPPPERVHAQSGPFE
jgi:hypothetical protein